jgi:membrane fusion protein, multidrug efflux system
MRRTADENRIPTVNIRKRIALPLLLVLPLTLSLAGCGDETKAGAKIVVRPVKVAVLQPSSGARALSFSGVVRPRIESAIGFRVAGKVVERRVNVGDRIAVGQVIARLDDTDLKLAENGAAAAAAAARTRRDVALINLERAAKLLPQSYISQAAYDIRKNELDAAAGALDMAEAQLRQAANAVGYATLAADKAGIVTAVNAEPGQVLAIGQPIVSLAEAGETEIAIAVPEQDHGHLSVGQPTSIKLWTAPGIEVRGRIREIAGQADPASRTYAVRVAMDAPPAAMRLGMTASVTIGIDGERSDMVVPLSSLTGLDGKPAVFVVDPASNVVRERPVNVNGVASDGARIVDGLTAGDAVVIAGVQFLRDGMEVRVPVQQ